MPQPPEAAARQRADLLLVARGLAPSRARAQALVMAGRVSAGGRAVTKPGEVLPGDAALAVSGPDHPWVSRGGIKLAHGLAAFGLSPVGLRCLDVGASTGGFTDVLLAAGAARVHAVDVGHGQLAWTLRQDPRVVVHERTNARYLDAAMMGGAGFGALVCDASFIGLATLLPAPLSLCAPGAWAVALIKPQFEAGRAAAKGGVVRDPAIHAAVCARVRDWWAALPGWSVIGVEPSPITGPEGNREFLIGARYAG